ncbi:MAG: ECF transporter S component [Clostridia bacterium]|nr:ECF transporter S component [Clostridia bacterium]
MITIKNASVRKVLKIIIPFLLVPAVIVTGVYVFKENSYMFISVAVIMLSMLLFVSGFEKKKTGTRRLIIVAIMTALSVVGRFIPIFKPVTALTVITAVYIGGEAGFLVGSLSALISNFWFGQGPWTPFQMFAWGMIGLVGGLLSKFLKKSHAALITYGVLAGIVYSFIMDFWALIWNNEIISFEAYLASLVTAIPYTAVYAVSNMLFFALLAKPFGEKLERVKLKYGV